MPTKSIKTRFKWLFGAYKGLEGVMSQSLAVKMSSKPKKQKSDANWRLESIEDYDSIESIGPTDDEYDSDDSQRLVIDESGSLDESVEKDSTKEDAVKEREKEPVVSDVDGNEKDGQEGDDIRFNELIAQLLENRPEYEFAAHMFEGCDLEEETVSDQFNFYNEVDNLLALIQSSTVDTTGNDCTDHNTNKEAMETYQETVYHEDGDQHSGVYNSARVTSNNIEMNTECPLTENVESASGSKLTTTITMVNNKAALGNDNQETFICYGPHEDIEQLFNQYFGDGNENENVQVAQSDTVNVHQENENDSFSDAATENYEYSIEDGHFSDTYNTESEANSDFANDESGTENIVVAPGLTENEAQLPTDTEGDGSYYQQGEKNSHVRQSRKKELPEKENTIGDSTKGIGRQTSDKNLFPFLTQARNQEMSYAQTLIEHRLTMLRYQTEIMRTRLQLASPSPSKRKHLQQKPLVESKKVKAAETYANPNIPQNASKDSGQNSENKCIELDETHHELLSALRFICPMTGCNGIAGSIQALKTHWLNNCHFFGPVPPPFRVVPIDSNEYQNENENDDGDDAGDEGEDDMDVSPVAPPRRGKK